MRLKDFRGAQEYMGAVELMRSRIVCKLSGRKISGFWRLVKMSVLEGGVGWVNGGMLLRSSDRVDLRLRKEEFEPVEERESAGVACCDSA